MPTESELVPNDSRTVICVMADGSKCIGWFYRDSRRRVWLSLNGLAIHPVEWREQPTKREVLERFVDLIDSLPLQSDRRLAIDDVLAELELADDDDLPNEEAADA